MTDPTQLAAEAAAVAAAVIPTRRRRPRRAQRARQPGPRLTAAQVVDRIVRCQSGGVIAAVVYDHSEAESAVAVHPNYPPMMDNDRARAITRLCRGVLSLGNDAVSLDVILDDSVRVVVEALDPGLQRVIAVFVVAGHHVGKSIQRLVRQSKQHLAPEGGAS